MNDWLSVGGSAQLMYTQLELTIGVPRLDGPDGEATIDGDDVLGSFNLGATINVSDRTRLGLVYQYEFSPEYSGDVDLSNVDLSVGVDTELTLATFFRVGLTHQLTDQLWLHATVG